jgi:hypothetical protein
MEWINGLGRKLEAIDTELVNMKPRQEIVPGVFDRNLALNQTERVRIRRRSSG